MAQPAQYRREAGSPDQLPFGAATNLNRANEAALRSARRIPAPGGGSPGPTGTRLPPETFSGPSELIPPAVGGDEEAGLSLDRDEQGIVFGSSERAEGRRLPFGGGPTPTPVPEGVIEHLPILAQAAADPGAPPAARALFEALVDALTELGA